MAQSSKTLDEIEPVTNRGAKRPPPAYQEYASDVLANLEWRMMTFAERGLWDTLRKEIWVNGSVPKDPQSLALLLNKPVETIRESLTPRVLSFFLVRGEALISHELEAYREQIAARHRAMANGGRNGGLQAQDNARQSRAAAASHPSGRLKGLRRDETKRDEWKRKEMPSRSEFSKEQSEWVADYERGTTRHDGSVDDNELPDRY